MTFVARYPFIAGVVAATIYSIPGGVTGRGHVVGIITFFAVGLSYGYAARYRLRRNGKVLTPEEENRPISRPD